MSGAAVYPSDTLLPDMLYGAILGCPYPNALVKSVDTTEAERVRGVRAVITRAPPLAPISNGLPQARSASCSIPLQIRGRRCGPPLLLRRRIRRGGGLKAHQRAISSPCLWWMNYSAIEPGTPSVHQPGNVSGGRLKSTNGAMWKKDSLKPTCPETGSSGPSAKLHTTMEPPGCVAMWDRDQLTIWESTA